jgi:hypothetical protein
VAHASIGENKVGVKAMKKMRIAGVIWVMFCLGFIGFGVYLSASQHRRLTTFQPTEAEILKTDVEYSPGSSQRGSSQTDSQPTYTPIVEYQYHVGGQVYSCDAVFPFSARLGGTQSWAQRVVKPFRTGQKTAAYYNPHDPSDAFLVKKVTFLPYFFILVPTILAFVGIAMAGTHKERPPIERKRRRSIGVAIVWQTIGLLSAGHYFSLFRLGGEAYDYFEGVPLAIFGFYAAVGLLPVCYALPSSGLAGRIKAAIFFSLLGAVLGLFIGGFAGVVAGNWYWMAYGTAIGAALFAVLGLISGTVHSS